MRDQWMRSDRCSLSMPNSCHGGLSRRTNNASVPYKLITDHRAAFLYVCIVVNGARWFSLNAPGFRLVSAPETSRDVHH